MGRWWSVDSLADQMPAWSPYNYAFNNPISYTDPDGRSPEWIPEVINDKISLIQEQGDNAETLAQFLGVSQSKANGLYSTMNEGVVTLTDDIKGVEAINQSINTANSKKGTLFGMETPGTHDYNCFTSCLSISQEIPFAREDNHTSSTEFEQTLRTSYTDVTDSHSEYKFGSTVLKFEENRYSIFSGSSSNTVHGALYLGTSKDGTIHTWSKNGMVKAPAVKTVESLKGSYDSWLFGGNTSFYNLK